MRAQRGGRVRRLEPTRADLMVRGVAYLALMALVVGLVVAQFSGTFAAKVTVIASVSETGDSLVPGSDVKLRGVLVGRVAGIDREQGRPGAIVTLRLDPAEAGGIPADVRARSLPANFFGQTFIDLVAPKTDTGPAIRTGARIPADTSAGTAELQDVFARLYRVLSAVQPAKLATVLGALAEALDGRGAAVGTLIGTTDAYLRDLKPALPALQADISAFAEFAAGLNRRAPSLLDSVDDVLVLARTLVDRQQQFLALLGGGLGLTADARKLVDQNAARLIKVGGQTRAIVGVLGKNPNAFSDGFVDLGAFLGGFAMGPDGRVSLDAQISPGPLRSYGAADCPRYPGLAGPNCAGGTNAAAAGSSPVYGGMGPVGSVTDRIMFGQVLTALEAGRGSSGDVGMLLAGSLLRGQTVVLPESAQTTSAEGGSARDASERGPAYEKRSEERERAISAARTRCHIGAAVAETS